MSLMEFRNIENAEKTHFPVKMTLYTKKNCYFLDIFCAVILA